MKISIITITYNSAATLEETLLSVINQTYHDIEYIIVDGKSTDDTLKIIDKHKDKISKVISEKDKGLYDALNKGIDMATGDVIGILHSDDFYIDNQVIEKYAKTFLKNNSDSVYSDLYYVDKSNTDKIIRKWKSGDYSEKSFINGWMPPHPTFFLKKEIYKKFGKFNTDFKSAADYELMLRFIEKNKISISYLPEYTVKMRVGGKSNVSVQNRVNANFEDRRAWEINGLKPRFYTLYLKPFRKILQFF
ncbi:glycosyl transferase [Sphingobacteriaceae bacterium]|nr:glycosyl transferase [Sphingobacteriaceae bacterium]